MFYLVKTPWWLQKFYHECTWKMKSGEKKIYLSFDDGPHPEATPFVLSELAKYNARATFFCIGENVIKESVIYRQLISAGHATGNHTFNHLNGWKTNTDDYLDNISKAGKVIKSALFRPPYGKASKLQLRRLSEQPYNLKAVMWTVLSGDFDPDVTPEKCLNHVTRNAGDGSIVVFHDSAKAFTKLRYALPAVLEHFSKIGFTFEKIEF